MGGGDAARGNRVMTALMRMNKLDIAALRRAGENGPPKQHARLESNTLCVMAGPAEGQVPAIHALRCLQDRKDVDARAGKFTQPAQAWLRAPGMTAEH